MMRPYFTPVAGYLFLHDIQHFMNFSSLLISASLQAHASFITKGWIPVCPWAPQPVGLGRAAPHPAIRGSMGATSHHPCVTEVQVRSLGKLATGTGGKAHGNTDFSNSALALHTCTKRYLTLPEHLPFQGKALGTSGSHRYIRVN